MSYLERLQWNASRCNFSILLGLRMFLLVLAHRHCLMGGGRDVHGVRKFCDFGSIFGAPILDTQYVL